MKKVIFVLALSVMLSMLTACGSGGVNGQTTSSGEITQPPQSSQSQQTDVSEEEKIVLEDVYNSIIAAQEENVQEPLIFFPETDIEMLNGLYYGISDIELTQVVDYQPPVVGAASEIMLVQVADSSDVRKVVDILQNRIDSEAGDTLYTDRGEQWAKRAEIQVSGNYVCMIVLPEGYTIPENVFRIE